MGSNPALFARYFEYLFARSSAWGGPDVATRAARIGHVVQIRYMGNAEPEDNGIGWFKFFVGSRGGRPRQNDLPPLALPSPPISGWRGNENRVSPRGSLSPRPHKR
jgi:hypothetical protein